MIANSTFLWGCRGCFSHFRVTKSFHRDLPTHIHASLGILREENLAELDSTRPRECSSVTWPKSILCPMFIQESSPPKGWGIHDFTRRTARCSTSPRGPLAAPSLHSPSLGSCGVVSPQHLGYRGCLYRCLQPTTCRSSANVEMEKERLHCQEELPECTCWAITEQRRSFHVHGAHMMTSLVGR